MAAPTYTNDQIKQYYNHIQFPSHLQYTSETIQSQSVTAQISFLNSLIRHQLVHIPFEDLDLHYAPIKRISLDQAFLFDKYITRASGRGGYCMQNSSFFATILRSLGFTISSHGARISLQYLQNQASLADHFIGYAHQINIVHLANGSYFCDVGFGAAGPTLLVPLEDGFTALNTGDVDNVASTMRLHKGWPADTVVRNTDTEQWIYSIRYDKADAQWIQCYAFSKTEFFAPDFEVMSWHVSTDPSSMFVNNVLVQKFIMSEDGERLIGDVTLFGTDLKERKYGKSEVLMEIASETDRVHALEKFLNVRLSEDEKQGIVGHKSEVK